MQFLNGYVFYNTFIPSNLPCEFGGTGYLDGVVGETGDRPIPVFTNRDGIINSWTWRGGIKGWLVLGGTTVIKTIRDRHWRRHLQPDQR